LRLPQQLQVAIGRATVEAGSDPAPPPAPAMLPGARRKRGTQVPARESDLFCLQNLTTAPIRFAQERRPQIRQRARGRNALADVDLLAFGRGAMPDPKCQAAARCHGPSGFGRTIVEGGVPVNPQAASAILQS
jgi:hypothetical protein